MNCVFMEMLNEVVCACVFMRACLHGKYRVLVCS